MNSEFENKPGTPENNTCSEQPSSWQPQQDSATYQDQYTEASESQTCAAPDASAENTADQSSASSPGGQNQSQQNSFIWNQPAQSGATSKKDRKPNTRGRSFAKAMLAIVLSAMVVLSAYAIVDIVQYASDKSSSANSSADNNSGIVTQQTGFTQDERVDSEALSTTEVASKIRPAVVGVVNYSMNSLTAAGYGSGVIINNNGYIVTNYHVIENADRVKIVLYDETEALAQIIGYDEETDLAVLQITEDDNIKHSDLTYASFGDSDELQIGETVIAIGNPGGLEFAGTITKGIVSGLNVKSDLSGSMGLIQTDAAINPGNSGGPLVDLYGNVIGITSQKIVATDYEGMGFAIPINQVKPIVDSIITYGYVPGRPLLGITGSDIDEYVARFNGVPQGVLISSIDSDSDLVNKGVKKNDIITSFNDVTITSMDELNAEKEKCSAGDKVDIGIYRYSDNTTFTVSVVLSEYKPD